MPASKSRTAGGCGWMWPSSRPTRRATTSFSLQVLTNRRYFCRLSKKRKFFSGEASCRGAGSGDGELERLGGDARAVAQPGDELAVVHGAAAEGRLGHAGTAAEIRDAAEQGAARC